MPAPIPPATDYDENGFPHYRFPPFPDPPEGVDIVPFKSFKPSGIQRPPLGFPDDIELDGEGVPTCKLMIDRTDDNEHVSLTKKKRKKKRNGGNGVSTNGRSVTWWEEWAEGEAFRTLGPIDLELPAFDRIEKAVHEFQSGRRFNPELQSVYDHFCLFIGLLARSIQPPISQRIKSLLHQSGDTGEDADFDSDEELDMKLPQSNVDGHQEAELLQDNIDPEEQEDYIKRQEEEEDSKVERLESFLNDPVFSTKVFLSSHFRDKGLIWSPSKLHSGPILLDFLFEFIIRNNALPEYHPKLRPCLLVIDQAKKELPATGTIGYALPEQFGRICKSTWGVKAKDIVISNEEWEIAWEEARARAQRPFKETKDAPTLPVMDVEELEKKMDDVAPIEGNELDWDIAPDPWSSSANLDDNPENPWNIAQAEAEAAWDDTGIVPCFMNMFGPVEWCFAHTHIPGILEESHRSIGAMYEPGTFDGGQETTGLACVVLKRWKKPKGSELSDAVVRNLLEEDGGQPKTSVPGHRTRDDIKVLADPSLLKWLIPDMVIGGNFVKLVPKEDIEGDDVPKGEAWWYIEKVLQVLPSYYAEHSAKYIANLIA